MGAKLVAAEVSAILGDERDPLEARDALDALHVRPAGDEMIECGEEAFGPEAAHRLVLQVADPSALLDRRG
jgi:hypothetical protein